MIISASRRTDIPAFYSDWFMNRLEEGYVIIPNPRNANRLGRVELSPSVVDCIVFWTKNPKPMLDKLRKIEEVGYSFYFLFSLLPYDKTIETNLPPKRELLQTFKELSNLIGADRVIWRYDPIFFDAKHTVDWHLMQFKTLCEELSQFTRQCIISFIDLYKSMGSDFRAAEQLEMITVAEGFSQIASTHGISIRTCAEEVDLSACSIGHAACIDKTLIEQITGCAINAKRDVNQRLACRCIESIDIGMYDTCINGCSYCYATSKSKKSLYYKHDPHAAMLIGKPTGNEIIYDRTLPSNKNSQLKLF